MTDIPKLSARELRALAGDKKQAIAIIKAGLELRKRLKNDPPKTKDELWWWIKRNIGVEITRTAVCGHHCAVEGTPHVAPMDFLWDMYAADFPDYLEEGEEPVTSALLLANRGGSKTFIVALLHYINSTFKPGCWGLTFGATQAQSDYCYEHLTGWVTETVEDPDTGEVESRLKKGIKKSIETLTQWYNSAKVSIVVATKRAVNGPHPQKAHGDEVEQMDDEAWEESRNMAMAKRIEEKGPNGEDIVRIIRAQDILTSTRKSARGRMQSLLDRIADATKRGLKPPYKLYIWCFVETTENQPNCRSNPANAGRPDSELCDCQRVLGAGKMKDGSERTFDKVCGGRLYYSQGWRPLDEVHNTFQQNSPQTWQAQQECTKPSTEGNYLEWDEREHEVYGFQFDPDNGPVYMSVDWGGTNPHAVNWYQRLAFDLPVRNVDGDERTIPEGSIVCFDEIYKAEISVSRLAEMVFAREMWWEEETGKRFHVAGRFADPQGKAAKIEFSDAGMRTIWPVKTRDFDYMLNLTQVEHGNGRLYADPVRCPMFVAEVVVWHADPRTGNQVDEFNHCMSNLRYAIANIDKMERRSAKRTKVQKNSTAKKRMTVIKRGSLPGRRKVGPVGYDSRGRGGHPADHFNHSLR